MRGGAHVHARPHARPHARLHARAVSACATQSWSLRSQSAINTTSLQTVLQHPATVQPSPARCQRGQGCMRAAPVHVHVWVGACYAGLLPAPERLGVARHDPRRSARLQVRGAARRGEGGQGWEQVGAWAAAGCESEQLHARLRECAVPVSLGLIARHVLHLAAAIPHNRAFEPGGARRPARTPAEALLRAAAAQLGPRLLPSWPSIAHCLPCSVVGGCFLVGFPRSPR